MDVRFDETTPNEDFKACVDQIEALSDEKHELLKVYLVKEKEALFQSFLNDLSKVLDRMIERLIVIPLFGEEHEFGCIQEAAQYISGFIEGENGGEFRKYEIIAKYSNGDVIDASFQDKAEATRFLKYLSG